MRALCVFVVLLTCAVAAPPDSKASENKETKPVAPVPAQAQDPVCGMTVETKDSEKTDYKGAVYYFCSREDREAFKKDPVTYLSRWKKEEKKK